MQVNHVNILVLCVEATGVFGNFTKGDEPEGCRVQSSL